MQTNTLPPLFAQILRPHLAVTETLAAAEVFYPQLGARKAYRSLGDAMSHEAGFLAFRDGDAPPQFKTPFADGWYEAAAQCDRRAIDSLHRHEDDDGVEA